ncbi:MAG: 5-keto-4-deoxy-D-glucarate aldolase [Pirellulaceae bacterium]|nr:MAG: 5-keto-4-deoxy-D-glucarate aldolase [Pirellulaceae bacterium]
MGLRQRLAEGKTCHVFSLSRILHPVVVEIFGQSGLYDGFWLDQEHASCSTEQMAVLAIAARANGLEMFVRMAPTGYSVVTQALEAGACGVMAAQVRSAEEAQRFGQWARFAPLGTRGLNGNGRDADYTFLPLPEFVERANRQAWVGIQIETLEALEQVDAIAALEAVDFLFVGPSDLSLALGMVGQFNEPRFREAVGRIAAAALRHGKPWGCVAPNADFAQFARDQGCRLLTIGNEVLALRHGAQRLYDTLCRQSLPT